MRTPDQMPEHKANLPRSSHVLSHDLGFTASTGHLLPVFHTILNPGEKINLGFDFNLRTMELEAAAFADLTTHVEYFFVPMQLIYQPFDNIYYDIKDQYSSLFDGQAVLPLLDFESVYTNLYTHRSDNAISKSEGPQVESIGQSAIRLFDMLGFNPIPIAVGTTNPLTSLPFYMPNVFPYQLLAYHCIYNYYYRQDTRELFRQVNFNWDQHYLTSLVGADETNNAFYLLHYRPLKNDYFTDVKVSPIVDVLNLNDKSKLDVVNSWLTRGIAYGNYNVITSGSEGVSNDGVVANAPTGGNSKYPNSKIQTNFGIAAIHNPTNTYIQQNSSPTGLDINTANIRAMFANEKLWSITGRAKKTYDDQTLAHFGFNVPHDVKHQISCFGHDIGKIHIGEVISTANTDLSPLGEIAGKGYGQSNSGRHSFVAPCHGVVMVIFSVECNHNYEIGFEKFNAVSSKYDFFIPEYDHLGMQPLFGYEISRVSGQNAASTILGWQYRYEQWKRRVNRTTGAFSSYGGTLSSWIPTYAPYYGNSTTPVVGKSGNPANTESYRAFLNWPDDVNQIFLAQYSNLWSAAYESVTGWTHVYDFDPFVVNSHIDCTLVSAMSDYSLPRLDA